MALILGGGSSQVKASNKSNDSGKQLFETHCKACHSLDLPRAQRLDKKGWQWVMDDMVDEYGLSWLTREQQSIIVQYLAKKFPAKGKNQAKKSYKLR